MTNLQTILVASIPFAAASLLASRSRIGWTDHAGWLTASSIVWAFLVAYLWHISAEPVAPILVLVSIASGAAVGWMLKRALTKNVGRACRARPVMIAQRPRVSGGRSFGSPNESPNESLVRAHFVVSRRLRRTHRSRWPIVVLLASVSSAHTFAQSEPSADAPADTSFLDRISVSVGVDFASAYYFRGIPQENQGFIGQPYASVSLNVFEGDGWIKDITFSLGTWNSLHSGPTGTGGTHDSPELWYETDIIVTASATLFDEWAASVIYTAYTSPNDSYNTVQEIAFKLAWNDSKHLGKWALNPYALIAFEIDDQADGGNSAFNPAASTNEGIYLELGIAPSLTLIESETKPVSLVFPVAVGFSLDDYYEDGAGDGGGAGVGFVDIGIEFSLPLQAVMPSDSGSWTLRTGPHFIWMSEDAADIGRGIIGGGTGDEFEIWWKLSLGWSF